MLVIDDIMELLYARADELLKKENKLAIEITSAHHEESYNDERARKEFLITSVKYGEVMNLILSITELKLERLSNMND